MRALQLPTDRHHVPGARSKHWQPRASLSRNASEISHFLAGPSPCRCAILLSSLLPELLFLSLKFLIGKDAVFLEFIQLLELFVKVALNNRIRMRPFLAQTQVSPLRPKVGDKLFERRIVCFLPVGVLGYLAVIEPIAFDNGRAHTVCTSDNNLAR
jgi:hypothetical protein